MGIASRSARVAIDVGGTFTDTVAVAADGAVVTHKAASDPTDFSRSVLSSLDLVREELGADTRIADLVHGTTVATNAILEHAGARTGLITTRGFRDVLELRRLRTPRLYDLQWEKPRPLVPRNLRLEVAERMDAHGEVVEPLDIDGARDAIRVLLGAGVESIAVSLLHAYANDAHERVIGDLIDELAPGLPRSLSSEVLPVAREYERTSTTVINAFVQPAMAGYLSALRDGLRRRGIDAPLGVMQSNGGAMSVEAAIERPVYVVESGPAAGVIAAAALARRRDLTGIVAFDMGGTTAKAALIEDGQPAHTSEFEVAAGVSARSRLSSGGGYAISVPFIDLAEVGAGGGSIVAIDRAGGLRVGPSSAGADPGPICYGRGGTRPTITDANVVLGYLDPDALLGGDMPLDAARARTEFDAQIATPLRLDLDAAAFGAHQLANATMVRTIKTVTIQRGRDPRGLTLIAFGGSGPVHAAAIARELGMPRVLVPPSPGLFAAVGLLGASREHHSKRTILRRVTALSPDDLQAACDRLSRESVTAIGERAGDLEIEVWAEMRYVGQAFDLPVRLPLSGHGSLLPPVQLGRRFEDEHQRTYGHRTGNEVELVHLRVVTRDSTSSTAVVAPPRRVLGESVRRVSFGPRFGAHETQVIPRSGLGRRARSGPLVIHEYDATTVVPPDFAARLDDDANIVIEARP